MRRRGGRPARGSPAVTSQSRCRSPPRRARRRPSRPSTISAPHQSARLTRPPGGAPRRPGVRVIQGRPREAPQQDDGDRGQARRRRWRPSRTPGGSPTAPVTASSTRITPVDDPGLAPDLGRDPPADQGHDRGRPGERRRRGRTRATAAGGACATSVSEVEGREHEQRRADGDHRLERDPDHVDRRLVVGRARRRGPRRSRSGRGREQREQVRDLDARRRPRRRGTSRGCGSGRPLVVVPRPSNAASLVGWVSATSRAAQSPTTSCTGAASAAIVNGTTSADAVVAVALAAQPRPGVDAGDAEARDHVARRCSMWTSSCQTLSAEEGLPAAGCRRRARPRGGSPRGCSSTR